MGTEEKGRKKEEEAGEKAVERERREKRKEGRRGRKEEEEDKKKNRESSAIDAPPPPNAFPSTKLGNNMTPRGGKIDPARWASPVSPKLGLGWAIKFLARKKSSQIWPGPVGPGPPEFFFFALKRLFGPTGPIFRAGWAVKILARKNRANFGPVRFWPGPLLARPSPAQPARLPPLMTPIKGRLGKNTTPTHGDPEKLIQRRQRNPSEDSRTSSIHPMRTSSTHYGKHNLQKRRIQRQQNHHL